MVENKHLTSHECIPKCLNSSHPEERRRSNDPSRCESGAAAQCLSANRPAIRVKKDFFLFNDQPERSKQKRQQPLRHKTLVPLLIYSHFNQTLQLFIIVYIYLLGSWLPPAVHSHSLAQFPFQGFSMLLTFHVFFTTIMRRKKEADKIFRLD